MELYWMLSECVVCTGSQHLPTPLTPPLTSPARGSRPCALQGALTHLVLKEQPELGYSQAHLVLAVLLVGADKVSQIPQTCNVFLFRFVLKGPCYNPMDVINALMTRRGYKVGGGGGSCCSRCKAVRSREPFPTSTTRMTSKSNKNGSR